MKKRIEEIFKEYPDIKINEFKFLIDDLVELFEINKQEVTDKINDQHQKELNSGRKMYIHGLEDGRVKAIKEMIKLSDKIEAGKETEFDEWKAFKQFRNKLMDEIINNSNNIKESK